MEKEEAVREENTKAIKTTLKAMSVAGLNIDCCGEFSIDKVTNDIYPLRFEVGMDNSASDNAGNKVIFCNVNLTDKKPEDIMNALLSVAFASGVKAGQNELQEKQFTAFQMMFPGLDSLIEEKAEQIADKAVREIRLSR